MQYASIKFIYALIGKIAAGQSAERSLFKTYCTHTHNSYQIELMNSFILIFIKISINLNYYKMYPSFVVWIECALCGFIRGIFRIWNVFCHTAACETHSHIHKLPRKRRRRKNIRIAIANIYMNLKWKIFKTSSCCVCFFFFTIWMLLLNIVALYVVVLSVRVCTLTLTLGCAHHSTLFCNANRCVYTVYTFIML